MAKISCSLGVFAYNEAGNIVKLLNSLVSQELQQVEIAEIIVVSSASTDGTDDLVRSFSQQHPQVRLIAQARREGKSSAINLFLKEATQQVCVVISGDVVPGRNTIELLVAPFGNVRIGATGGRPVPENDPGSFTGYAVHLLWNLHHRMALIAPKLGEMIAFRKVMDSIPADSAVDEASIEAIIRKQGLELKYIPEAIIHNKGPENIKDFIKQRRRIQNGHLWLKNQQGYQVISQDGGTMLNITRQELREHPRDSLKLVAVMAVEAYGRLLGSWDYHIKGRNPFAWEIASSAKHNKNENR